MEMTDQEITTTNLTPELVKGKMLIALSKAEQSIQGLNDAEAQLVYNEDNLESIKKFLDDCKKAEKVVETERVALKEPYLEAGRSVDAGAKLIATGIAEVKLKAHSQYTKLCQDIERKRVAAEAEKNRVDGIKKAMSDFKMEYANKIAIAKSSQELVEIERRVNVEALNKNKYAEYLEDFKADCEAIRKQLTAQKAKVRELERLEKESLEAAQNGSDEKVLEIMEKKEVLEAQIAQTAINVQEVAVNQATEVTPTEPEIILPEIKGARRTWDFEIKDLAALYKKAPELVELSVNKDAVKAILKKKVEDGETKGVNEILHLNGLIRFYVKTTY